LPQGLYMVIVETVNNKKIEKLEVVN
jgi:hypothetical protein